MSKSERYNDLDDLLTSLEIDMVSLQCMDSADTAEISSYLESAILATRFARDLLEEDSMRETMQEIKAQNADYWASR